MGAPPRTPFPGARSPLEATHRDIFPGILSVGAVNWGARPNPTPEARKRVDGGSGRRAGPWPRPYGPGPGRNDLFALPPPRPGRLQSNLPRPRPRPVGSGCLSAWPALSNRSRLRFVLPWAVWPPPALPLHRPSDPRRLLPALPASRGALSAPTRHRRAPARAGGRLGEAAAVPRALGAAPAGPSQEAAQAKDHLLQPAAAAPEPAFPAHAVPGAAREGSAGRTARPHPNSGKDLVSEQALQIQETPEAKLWGTGRRLCHRTLPPVSLFPTPFIPVGSTQGRGTAYRWLWQQLWSLVSASLPRCPGYASDDVTLGRAGQSQPSYEALLGWEGTSSRWIFWGGQGAKGEKLMGWSPIPLTPKPKS